MSSNRYEFAAATAPSGETNFAKQVKRSDLGGVMQYLDINLTAELHTWQDTVRQFSLPTEVANFAYIRRFSN